MNPHRSLWVHRLSLLYSLGSLFKDNSISYVISSIWIFDILCWDVIPVEIVWVTIRWILIYKDRVYTYIYLSPTICTFYFFWLTMIQYKCLRHQITYINLQKFQLMMGIAIVCPYCGCFILISFLRVSLQDPIGSLRRWSATQRDACCLWTRPVCNWK